jgi:hypothetical protein
LAKWRVVTETEDYPMIVHAFLRFCMVLNPTLCQELEIAPADHAIVSQNECMRGIMMGSNAEFTYQGARWQIRGGVCKEVPASLAQIQHQLRASVMP